MSENSLPNKVRGEIPSEFQGQKRREFLANSAKFTATLGAVAAFPSLLDAANSNANSANLSVNSTSKETKMQTITLKNGALKSVSKHSTYQIPNAEAQRCVEDALGVGYPLHQHGIEDYRCST